ncbi:hypothetical protein I3842_01G053500 [Carya illinoinensis]|uniref:Uncharacterized protein n=1 Tax=Carya illinoinensis TaxID=32201 RepID=A0A922K3K4_CARIL|nr:hypothetical protein I3842_01G053500 [Carya illinoinensis]
MKETIPFDTYSSLFPFVFCGIILLPVLHSCLFLIYGVFTVVVAMDVLGDEVRSDDAKNCNKMIDSFLDYIDGCKFGRYDEKNFGPCF